MGAGRIPFCVVVAEASRAMVWRIIVKDADVTPW